MKKFFTLISMALVAMSVNAQTAETWDITSILEKNASDKYASIKSGSCAKEAITGDFKSAGTEAAPLAKGTTDAQAFAAASTTTLNNYILTGSTTNVTMKHVSTPNGNDDAEDKAWSISDQTGANGALSTDDCSPKFNVYVAGKGNPTANYFGYWVLNDNSEPSFKCPNDYQTFWTPEVGAAPSKGAYTEFTVKSDGILKIGVRIPKAAQNRKIYFVNKATGAVLTTDKYNAEGFNNNNTNPYTTYETTAEYSVAPGVTNQFIGYINVSLPANETYVMFSPDTQIGIFGFEFTVATGINNVKAAEADANAPIFNLAGQKVDKSQKGILIQNGRKFVNK